MPQLTSIQPIGMVASRLLAFCRQRPAQAGRDRTAVVLALNRKLLDAVVEAEDFVIQIERGDDDLQSASPWDPIAQLGVDLGVGVQISVAGPIPGWSTSVRPDIAVIVREAHTR